MNNKTFGTSTSPWFNNQKTNYKPTPIYNTQDKKIENIMNISAMDNYKNKSAEELRLEYLKSTFKNSTGASIFGNNPNSFTNTFGFNNSNPTTNTFGFNNSNPTTNTFGFNNSNPTTNTFGFNNSNPTTNTFKFNNPNPTTNTFGFNNPNPNPTTNTFSFNNPSSTTNTFGFNNPNPTTNTFANSTTNTFANPTTNTFANPTTNTFANLFNNNVPVNNNLFNNPTHTNNNLFTNPPVTNNLFNNPTSNIPVTNNLFNNPTTNIPVTNNLFNNPTTNVPANNNLFNNPTTNNLFNPITNIPATNNLFNNPSTSNLFNTSANNPTNNLFNNPSTSNLFTNPINNPATNNLFANPINNPTNNNLFNTNNLFNNDIQQLLQQNIQLQEKIDKLIQCINGTQDNDKQHNNHNDLYGYNSLYDNIKLPNDNYTFQPLEIKTTYFSKIPVSILKNTNTAPISDFILIPNKNKKPIPKITELLDVKEISAPILTKDGYFSEPSIDTLNNIAKNDPTVLKNIKDFVVGCHNIGHIKFIGNTDVSNLNLDNIISFTKDGDNFQEVGVYEENNTPPFGQGLNKPALCTFYNVWPTTLLEKHILKLKKFTENINAKFVSFDENTGNFTFQVEHF